jgi:HSP20 family protein
MAELPGFKKEDIDVRVGEDMLELRAEKKMEKETKDGNAEARERTYSAFHRAIRFPEQVIPSKVEGTMKNGVLSLRIPKEPTSTRLAKVGIK